MSFNQVSQKNKAWTPAVCADCKKDTMVPFVPNPNKPVYCRECWSKRRPSTKILANQHRWQF